MMTRVAAAVGTAAVDTVVLVVGKATVDEDRLDVDEEEQPQAAKAIVAAHRSTDVAFIGTFSR